jgi:GNAT superfamily N-acetyltransferase
MVRQPGVATLCWDDTELARQAQLVSEPRKAWIFWRNSTPITLSLKLYMRCCMEISRPVIIDPWSEAAPVAYQRELDENGYRLLEDLREMLPAEGTCNNFWFQMPQFHCHVYVGTAWIEDKIWIYISNYNTRPNYQHQGFFTAFLRHAQEVSKERGLPIMLINPRRDILDFLSRMGFVYFEKSLSHMAWFP